VITTPHPSVQSWTPLEDATKVPFALPFDRQPTVGELRPRRGVTVTVDCPVDGCSDRVRLTVRSAGAVGVSGRCPTCRTAFALRGGLLTLLEP